MKKSGRQFSDVMDVVKRSDAYTLASKYCRLQQAIISAEMSRLLGTSSVPYEDHADPHTLLSFATSYEEAHSEMYGSYSI